MLGLTLVICTHIASMEFVPTGGEGGATGSGGVNNEGKHPGGDKKAEIRVWAWGEVNPKYEAQEGFSKRAPVQTTLGEEWHAYYDLRGVKYSRDISRCSNSTM
jgi:hypothetical protein